MEIINVKVGKETKEQLEALVRKKLFKNINEAVRQIIKDHLNEYPELFAHGIDIEQLMKDASKMSDSECEKLAAEIFNRGERRPWLR